MIVDTITFDELIAADYPIFAQQEGFTSGTNFEIGTALAKLTATGNMVEYDSGGAGGAEVLYGFNLEAVDATANLKAGPVMLAGAINEGKLIFKGGGDKDTTRRDARLLGIFYVKVRTA